MLWVVFITIAQACPHIMFLAPHAKAPVRQIDGQLVVSEGGGVLDIGNTVAFGSKDLVLRQFTTARCKVDKTCARVLAAVARLEGYDTVQYIHTSPSPNRTCPLRTLRLIDVRPNATTRY